MPDMAVSEQETPASPPTPVEGDAAGGWDDRVTHAELFVARALRLGGDDVVAALAATIEGFYSHLGQTRADALAAECADVAAQTGMLDAFKQRVAEAESVTKGARDLVQGAGGLGEALEIVVSDKSVRALLREKLDVSLDRVRKDAALTVSAPEVRRPWTSVAREIENIRDLPAMEFDEVCREYGVKFRVLERELVEPFALDGEAADVVTLPSFVDALRVPSMNRRVARVAEILLKRNPMALLVVYAAVRAGHVAVHPRVEPLARLFFIRALLSFNAAETAFREASALWEDESATAELTPGERRRLTSLRARAARRSGRPDLALTVYTELFAQEPTVSENHRQLLGMVAGIDEPLTRALCRTVLRGNVPLTSHDTVFVADLLSADGAAGEALSLLNRFVGEKEPRADAFLGVANVGLRLQKQAMWESAVERFFAIQRVPVVYRGGDVPAPFAFGPAGGEPPDPGPLVSVVMTTFNAEATVEHAVRSVVEQTYPNWELFIVDDASADGTVAIIERLAAGDERIKVTARDQNAGTYVAKTTALADARGEFIAFHDSDDWMHPQRLAAHVRAMRGGAMCSTSQWVRMDADGLLMVRKNGPYRHGNPASTFYRRTALDRVGPFHALRIGADTELLSRVRSTFGGAAIVDIEKCLAIGLHHDASLTRAGSAAYDEHSYSPVRVAYRESWLRWHMMRLADGQSVAYDPEQGLPFDVPASIVP